MLECCSTTTHRYTPASITRTQVISVTHFVFALPTPLFYDVLMSSTEFDPSVAADGLTLGADGIWSSGRVKSVSYPEIGNARFHQVEDRSFWFRHRNNCVLAAVQRYVPAGPMLDIGGGNGIVSRKLADAGFPTVLLEPGETGTANALQAGVQIVIRSTLDGARFKESALAAVGMFDVLEHIEDDGAFLDLVGHCLAPGGLLFLTVPAYAALWSQEDVSAGHFRRYRRRQLRGLLQRHGFDVEYGTYIFSLLPLPILLTRTLPSRLGLRKEPSNETTRTEHGMSLIGTLLAPELSAVRRGWVIPSGGSLLFVARRGG